MTTSTSRTPIFSRSEPIFGICETLGDDLGVNPNWFRVALAPLLFWNPVATIVGYFATGLFLLALRLLLPDVRGEQKVAVTRPEAVTVQGKAADADGSDREKLPLAA